MTKHEVHALLTYLEFDLISMVEQCENDCNLDTTTVGVLYNRAHDVLEDIETTLTDNMVIPSSITQS